MKEKLMKSFFRQSCIGGQVILLFLFANCTKTNAQETQISLFDFAPLYLNPAQTGNFHGNWRAFINYRNQKAAAANAFTTASAGFDARFKLLHQQLGGGIYFLNDQAGVGGLNYSKIYASVSIERRLSDNYFVLGLQGGYVSGKRNDWFIWNPLTRDYDAPNGEENYGDNASYLDINTGILWKRKWKILEPQAGVSFHHINAPNTSFQAGGEEKEAIKISFHAISTVKYSDKLHFTPALLLTLKGGESFTLAGSDIAYRLTGRSRVKKVFTGIYLRNGFIDKVEALAFRAGTSIGNIDIALNYDIALADLNKSGKMGAFEVALIYRNIGLVLNSYSIPCERY